MYQIWSIRPSNQPYTSTTIYDNNPNLFCLEIHHGGRFTKFPRIKYVDGEIRYVDLLDIEDFSVNELDSIMQKLGYTSSPVIYYHFQIPNSGMQFGLRPLRNADDICYLAQYIGDNQLIMVYTEHDSTNLVTSYMKGLDQGAPEPYVGSYVDLMLCESVSMENDAVNDVSEEVTRPQQEPGEEHVIDQDQNAPYYQADFSNINELDDPIVEPEADVDMSDFNLNLHMDDRVYGAHQMLDTMDEVDDIEDLEVIDNDEWDSLGEQSDEERKRRCMLKEIVKEKKCNLGHSHKQSFYIGQKFKSKNKLKEKIEVHALETRRNLIFKKNDKLRLRAICIGVIVVNDDQGSGCNEGSKSNCGEASGSNKASKNNCADTSGSDKSKGKQVNSKNPSCPWVLHASRTDEESDWFVKTFKHKHTCMQTRSVRACTSTFISKQIMNEVESNPTVPLRALQDQFEKKYEVGVSVDKMFRAKATATKMVVGDFTKQYAILRDYCLELQSTNPHTTIKIQVHNDGNPSSFTRQFKRIYVCLGPLKQGFKACMRGLLGLDGTFMKGPFPGQILTAVGMDSNNGIYPLAYAIVEKENKSSWKWFLDCLGDDLEMGSNSNFTFISDRQKGLLPALEQIFPQAEHRYCLRHIHQNMFKTWKLKEYKEHLWKCATATTIPEFEHFMTLFDQYDRKACDWVKKIAYKHWTNSHFTGRAKSDVILNMCEVLNAKLDPGRDMPIISCLEFVRQYLMKRICNVLKVQSKCTGPLTPTATTILDGNMTLANQYRARYNGGGKFEVYGPWQDQHVVDTNKLSCSCRRWEITGIPCKHAIATVYEMNKCSGNSQNVYQWVDKVYFLDTWKKAYEFKIEPVKGRSMWPKSDVPTTLIPPPHNTQVGRPKKKRKQSQEERLSQSHYGAAQSDKLSRKHKRIKCTKCKKIGHNLRTCTGQGEAANGNAGVGGSGTASGGSGSRRGGAGRGNGAATDGGATKRGWSNWFG